MDVTAQVFIIFAADDERDLAVDFESDDAIDDMDARFFEPLGPLDIMLFVKARLDLDNRGHLLALFASFDERLWNGRVLARAVKAHLDGEHIRVRSRRVN